EGHVVFGRGKAVVWRSHDTYDIASAERIWSSAVSPAGIAFQTGRRGPLYVATGRGSERRVATGESVDRWTRSGTLLTFVKQPDGSYSLRLRSANGSLVGTLADDVTLNELEARTETPDGDVFYIADGSIWRTGGLRARALASLATLGFTTTPDLYAIGGGLVELLGRDWHD